MKPSTTLPALALFFTTSLAQTWSDCNPLNTTCAPNTALGVSNYSMDFTRYMMADNVWNWTAGKSSYGTTGLDFVINQRGDAPTVRSKFYIFYGTVECIFKAATGQGVVSSIVIQSDTLDEIDWEWIGGNTTHVQSNYFGKGNTTSYDRAIWHPVDSPQTSFHNYTTDWSQDKIDFYIDGNIVRTLKYEDANGGQNFPQTPSDVRLGIWAGGDKNNNNYTIEWAGGEVDYDAGPYTMTYGDHSGSFQSIKLLNETKPVNLDGDNGQTIGQKWSGLSQNAKIAIAAAVGGSFLIALCVLAFCCIRQRRVGKHEKLLEDAKYEKDRSELLAFRAEMGRQRSEKYAQMQSTPVPGRIMPSNTFSMNNMNSEYRGYTRH
ncbi:hypothetical protein LTR64_008542 [Lithohypha guttulata]|uniref:uncharacterized protein n=1 Tax=Lithohypha guttulata TaxID=1690604 RepID=UPI002DDFAD1E|nr:hypothetical protein LTR51_001692 [Lithohypha guttulata]